jgi:hypothetical protein
MAYEVFKVNLFYPNGNLYDVGGIVRLFCSKAIYGGRCMCAFNRKWNITQPISDFDAVALYPSAMSRLYLVSGPPKLITDFDYSSLASTSTAFIVEIVIFKCRKHYAFPLIAQRTESTINYNDNFTQPITMVVDNILLEDLILCQDIEFKIIRGYYWEGEKDYSIQYLITSIFHKRLEYKAQKNPMQAIYKLIMNSAYSKSIQRPIESDYKF